MHLSRIVILFCCLSGIAAAFLPWASQSLLGEVTLLKGTDPANTITDMNVGDGWFTFACFSLIVAIVISGNRGKLISRKKAIWIMLFALISIAITVYHAVISINASAAGTGDALVMKVSPGIGLYLTILVSIIVIILSFKHRLGSQKESV